MAFLNISVKNKNGVLKQIDSENYLGLADCTRLELYSFMVALGFNRGYGSDFDGAKDSLVREEYVKNNNIYHAFSALYFCENKDNIEDIANTDKTFNTSDRYANTGFNVMEDYMKSYGQAGLTLKLMADMDIMYQKIMEDLK